MVNVADSTNVNVRLSTFIMFFSAINETLLVNYSIMPGPPMADQTHPYILLYYF